jgi:hypothetical protein
VGGKNQGVSNQVQHRENVLRNFLMIPAFWDCEETESASSFGAACGGELASASFSSSGSGISGPGISDSGISGSGISGSGISGSSSMATCIVVSVTTDKCIVSRQSTLPGGGEVSGFTFKIGFDMRMLLNRRPRAAKEFFCGIPPPNPPTPPSLRGESATLLESESAALHMTGLPRLVELGVLRLPLSLEECPLLVLVKTKLGMFRLSEGEGEGEGEGEKRVLRLMKLAR